jgi:aryl-alcohol dehydrogenase-like predicted oxidoreductase
MPAWLATKALWISDRLGLHRFEWVQNGYSLLECGDEAELFPLLADQGLGYTPFSPLAGGWLTGKYHEGAPFPAGSRMTLRPEPYRRLVRGEIFQGLERLRAHAAARGVDMAALALAWVMANPLVTAPILGPRRPAQLEPARVALELTLDAEERELIASFFAPPERER